MPTGYTSQIEKGITFPEFALSCARAFGALVTMRDAPPDAEIPDEFKPDPYHAKALKEAEAELTRLREMTVREASKEQVAERKRVRAEVARAKRKNTTLLNRYNAMLAKVVQWEPPTADHAELKNFMVSQIRESIRFDCGGGNYYAEMLQGLYVTPAYYLLQRIKKAEESVARHTEALAQEAERCRDRTNWVRSLRQSLA